MSRLAVLSMALWIALALGTAAALADARGDCFSKSGEVAIRACTEAIALNPRDAVSYINRAYEYLQKGDYAGMKAAVMDVVKDSFRPEFINRIDDICVFQPLGQVQIRAIVEIQLAQLKRRLADRNLELVLDAGALDRLSEAGYDPVYGARPLKRAIQQQVENPLAQAILAGKFLPGDRIQAHANGNGLEFSKLK